MQIQNPWLWLPVAALATPAYATTYLSVEQAQQLMFPGATLTAVPIRLDEAQRAAAVVALPLRQRSERAAPARTNGPGP